MPHCAILAGLVCVTGLLLAACVAADAPAALPESAPAPAAPATAPAGEAVLPADAVEARLAAMTREQKAAQLFIVRPDALDPSLPQRQIDDPDAAGLTSLTEEARRTLAECPVGGVVLFGKNITGPAQLSELLAQLQQASDIPLFLAVDEEGGAVARLANHPAFDLPRYESAAAVGAQGTGAALEMGRSIGGYLHQYGFTMDFAPVADIATNPDNPVIGTRAFSTEAKPAAALAAAMAQGLWEQGVLPTFKHFPGHGDTAEDSHKGLAVLHKSYDELAACEWLPYGFGADPPLPAGSYAVMAGHIAVPAVTGDDTPASLSPRLIGDILRGELHDPLVVTDSLAMQAITDRYEPDEAAVLALRAGCDMLLMPAGLEQAYQGVLRALERGELSEERLDESVRRILQYKQRCGLTL